MSELVICRTAAFLRALGGDLPPAAHNRRAIINALGAARGGIVTRDELAEALYGDDATGGSDWWPDQVRVAIHYLRHQHGYQIKTHGWRGYSLLA